MTPLEFSSQFVSVDWDDYVCLVHDPRNDMYKTYTVDRLQNVAGGPPVVYLNVPIEEMKRITMEMVSKMGSLFGWVVMLGNKCTGSRAYGIQICMTCKGCMDSSMV